MMRRVAMWLVLCSMVVAGGTGCAWLRGDDDEDYTYSDTDATYKADTSYQYDRGDSSMK